MLLDDFRIFSVTLLVDRVIVAPSNSVGKSLAGKSA
jgi:hypothetical protein